LEGRTTPDYFFLDRDIAIIKEEFEGNVLYYKTYLKSKELLKFWGFDDDGVESNDTFRNHVTVEFSGH